MDPLDPDNTKNQVILILKYYLYKCRSLGDKPSINGGLKYLKYCIKIEKTTINFLTSTQREYICKKWLPFETVLNLKLYFFHIEATSFLVQYSSLFVL
jgi:hypothetical protein